MSTDPTKQPSSHQSAPVPNRGLLLTANLLSVVRHCDTMNLLSLHTYPYSSFPIVQFFLLLLICFVYLIMSHVHPISKALKETGSYVGPVSSPPPPSSSSPSFSSISAHCDIREPDTNNQKKSHRIVPLADFCSGLKLYALVVF